MAGIAGIFRWQGAPLEDEELRRLARPSRFRALHGCRHILSPDRRFGLAVLAGEPGDVPVSQQELGLGEGALLVADARLDNRTELIADLRREGFHPSSGHSDAALILAAYLYWLEECPRHLIGDFAFAVADPVRSRLFAARSLGGLRGCHYSRSSGAIEVGTDVRMLVRSDSRKATLDGYALGDYLVSNVTDLTRTPFAGARQLAPAHSLSAGPSEFHIRRFWRPEDLPPLAPRTRPKYVEEFRELLVQSISDRVGDAREIAVFLSGGLDSSAIAAILGGLPEGAGGRRLFLPHFFSRRLPEIDEREYVLALRGIGLTARPFCTDGRQSLGRGSSELDSPQPMQDLFLDRALREAECRGIRICLLGQGGDELFAGPRRAYFDHMRSGRWWKVLPWIREGRARGYSWASQVRSYMLRPLLPGWVLRKWEVAHRNQPHLGVPDWVDRGFQNQARLQTRHPDVDRGPVCFAGVARQLQFQQILAPAGTAQWLAFLGRRMAASGTTLATPFQDQRLAEFVLRIPCEVCAGVGAGQTKWVLRESMRGWLPETVRARIGKSGGQGLVSRLLVEHATEFQELFRRGRLASLGLIDEVRLSRAFQGWLQTGRGAWPQAFLASANLEIWMREQVPVGEEIVF